MGLLNSRIGSESGDRKITGNVYNNTKSKKKESAENQIKIKNATPKNEDKYAETNFVNTDFNEKEFKTTIDKVKTSEIDENLVNQNFFTDTQEEIKEVKENESTEAQKEENSAAGKINIPENLKNDYYGLYNHMMGSVEADNEVSKLINDASMWSPDSMSTSKEKLISKLDGIFNNKGSVFQDKGSVIVQAALDNGINPELFAAKIMAENDLGTSQKTKDYNNPGWIRGSDNSYNRYDTIEEGINSMATLLSKADEREQGGTNGYNLASQSKSMVEVDSVYAPGNTRYSEFLAKRLLTIQAYQV